MNQIILVGETFDQIITDGIVEVEVDVAALVDLHLLDADVVQAVGEGDEEHGGLDRDVSDDQHLVKD